MNIGKSQSTLSLLVILSLILLVPCQVALASETAQSVDAAQSVQSADKPVSVNAEVKVTQATQQDKIAVTKDLIPLTSRLKKKYTAARITFQNNAKTPIEIVSANVVGGINGQQGYLLVRKKSGAAIAGLLGGGLLVGLFTFGAGLLLGMIASPIVWGVNRSKNKKALREGLPLTNQMPLGVLNPGETASVSTLVPFGTQPQIEATFRDVKTGELFTISQ